MTNMQLLQVRRQVRFTVLCFLFIMWPISAINNGSSYDTIVIGGGMAGVKAAVDIANSGQKVAVLQANDYLGGRLLSKDVALQAGGNLKFDEGASWIHGNSEQHPITKLALDVVGLVTEDTDDDLIVIHDTSGNDVTTTSQTQSTLYDNIQGQFQNLDPSISMQQAITNQDSSALSNYLFMFNVANNVQFETSGSIDKLSASGYNDEKFQGTERLILSGYQKFVQTLSKKANFELFLSHKVKKVVYNSPRIINQIILENGVTVYATHVVIAVPLGVLKAGGITFEPELPSWKKQAISSIGFGNVCKILLDFTGSSFFTQTQHYIGVADSDVTKRGLVTYFLNLKQLANIPALMTFGLGANADQAESMSDADLKTLLVNRLNAFTASSVTASDFNVYRTSWRSKQNFRGTYSYASTSTRSNHWDDMAKTISQTRWYFCGEHTYSKYRGTVHGAYLSGQKAASQVIENQKARIGLIIGLSVMGGVLLIAGIVGGICLYKHCQKKKQLQVKESSQQIQN